MAWAAGCLRSGFSVAFIVTTSMAVLTPSLLILLFHVISLGIAEDSLCVKCQLDLEKHEAFLPGLYRAPGLEVHGPGFCAMFLEEQYNKYGLARQFRSSNSCRRWGQKPGATEFLQVGDRSPEMPDGSKSMEDSACQGMVQTREESGLRLTTWILHHSPSQVLQMILQWCRLSALLLEQRVETLSKTTPRSIGS